MLILAIALATPFVLFFTSEIRRKRRISEVNRQSKVTALSRAMRRPAARRRIAQAPSIPVRKISLPSPNNNRRSVQRRIDQLRQIYPGKSEAWLWDKAHSLDRDLRP